MEKISDSINKIVFTSLLKNKGFILSTLIFKWEKVLGKNLGLNSIPLSLKISPKDNFKYQLLIAVRNNAIGTDFFFQKDILIYKFNQFFNQDIINSIKIINREDLWRENL